MSNLPSSVNKGKILLVQNDDFLTKLYSEKFIEAGFEVISASDGEKGFELAKNSKPDVAIIDLLIPKMDGQALLEKMRRDPDLKDVKVIILANLIPEKGIEKVARLGIVDYIVKSDTSASKLVEKVIKVLST